METHHAPTLDRVRRSGLAPGVQRRRRLVPHGPDRHRDPDAQPDPDAGARADTHTDAGTHADTDSPAASRAHSHARRAHVQRRLGAGAGGLPEQPGHPAAHCAVQRRHVLVLDVALGHLLVARRRELLDLPRAALLR